MSKFYIFNPTVKDLIGVFEFDTIPDAESYTAEHYGPAFRVKKLPETGGMFQNELSYITKSAAHPDIVRDGQGIPLGIVDDQNKLFIHCGNVSPGDLEKVIRAKFKPRKIAAIDFALQVNDMIMENI